MQTVDVSGIPFGERYPLALIAGPCVIENEGHAQKLASAVQNIARQCGISLLFKASFDKANRTSLSSYRGPGLKDGLSILQSIKDSTGLPVLTDIHEVEQAEPVSRVADVIQIPAFLCRQTDLLVAAATTGAVINLKKGQFLAPLDLQHAIAKVADSGNSQILVTERGTVFGYHDLVVDFRTFPQLRSLGYPVIFDVTHSVQQPGAGDGASSGQPEFIETLACAAVAAGINGIFFEVHDRPEVAKSDGENALNLDRLEPLLERLLAIESVRINTIKS